MKAPGRILIRIFRSGVLVSLAVVLLVSSPGSSALSHRARAYLQEFAIPADGTALYRQKCSSCHETARDYTPARSVLAGRSPDEIIRSLTTGSMKPQATGLTAEEIRAIAVFLTGKQPGASGPTASPLKLCSIGGPKINLEASGWNGWGRDLDNSRYQPAPGLRTEDVSRLKVKWSFAYQGGRTNSQPTIIGDRLYVSSAPGLVYCLNATTGCAYWSYDPGAGVRAAISVGRLPGGGPARFAAWFGDTKSFVHAVDAATGAPLWKTQIETHPVSRVTGAPVLYQGRLYVPLSSVEEGAGRNDKYECCTFRGSLVALDASTGKIIWKSHSIPEPLRPYKKSSAGTQMYGPAGGAIWSAPTIDPKRKVIYAATGDSYTDVETKGADAIIAFDLESGKIKWINQVTPNDNFLVGCNGPNPPANCPQPLGPDFDFGSSPILRTLGNGKQVILAGQKSGIIYALDPDNGGKILWKVQLGHGATLGGIQWGPAADQQTVYVAVSDVNAPIDKRRPGITALRISTGEQVWHTPAPMSDCRQEGRACSNAQSAAVTLIPGVVFSGSIDGHLRAYSVKDGIIIWDFNTAANTYETVNGLKVKGGALNATGPVIVNGTLYVNSGYGGIPGQSGNVLLAFTVDGK